MITKLAISIVKKNIPIINCIGPGQTLKLVHSFSDNNKKNPFGKFKRTNPPKTDSETKKTETLKSQQNPQPQSKPQSPNSSQNQFNPQQTKPNSHRKTAGIKKPIDPTPPQKTNIQPQNPLEPQTNQTSSQAQKSQASQNPPNIDTKGFNKFKKTSQDTPPQTKFEPQKPEPQINKTSSHPQQKPSAPEQSKKTTPLQESEKISVKGFNKFKKPTQKPESTFKTSSNKTEQLKKPQNQNANPQSTANSKTPEEEQRENAYKKTEQKIESDKEEWQNFLQKQIKKSKDNLKNSKPHKKAPDWKNFDFSFKKNGNSQQKPPNPQKPNPWNTPKTPYEAMKMLFFAGLGIYVGSLLLTELFSMDNSKMVDTEEMMQLLKQGKIRQTWFLTTVQSLSEDSSRTKKYLCSTLDNGQIIKSQSNSDFQIEWSKTVDQFNMNAQTYGGANPVVKKVPIVKKDNHVFNSVRSTLSMILLFMFIRSMMGAAAKGKGGFGKGGLSGMFENTKSHRFRQAINVKFNDVVGMNKAKEEIVEFIDFLKNAQKYNKLGAKIPRGALLTGPPGTGKTMLAKACAGESGVPFFTISGSQFMEMYVGVGAQRVRSLFAEAKEAAPSIIFIDEIDAVGKKRSSGVGGGNDERDNTLNQLLVEMDGFDQTANVIVFAATNQREVLDPALTRPGRFDRLIEVGLPDIEGRKEIFMVHLKVITLDVKYEMEEYAKRLATLTPGFSGADIKNLCNEAAIIAARNEKKFVSMIDFELASERIIGGVEKKSSLITPETKRTVAYHECGHGVVSWFMEHASPLLKLTIIPRSKGALGFAQYLPNENQVYTRKQLEDQICVILGGRIAEEIFFKKISTGASDDLQKAYKVAKAIVSEYGMGEKLGWLGFNETEYAKEYSHVTEEAIDEEMIEIIEKCSVKTREIINSKRGEIEKLAETLLKEETVDQRVIQSILGERPFKSSKQYEDYIREKRKMEEEDKVNEGGKEVGPVSFKGLRLLEGVKMREGSLKVEIVENS